ncbi:MAG: tetratricopeptide repeat protein [Myxococcota bacterium]
MEETTERTAQRTEALARAAVPLLRPTRPPPPAIRMPPVDATQASLAQDALAVLEEVVPSVRDDSERARLFLEIGMLLGFPLGERRVALEALRQAHRRWRAPHVARAYRKAAVRAEALDEALVALEAEIELTPTPDAQSSLLTARGELLEQRNEPGAARGAYAEAVARTPDYLPALEALERLASDPKDAARWARAQSQATSDPSIAAEHAARAANYLLATGDLDVVDEARELVRSARVHAPSSPTVLRVLEAALARRGVDSELPALRQAQLVQGAVGAEEGWLDLAIVARYRLGDTSLARRALENLLEHEEIHEALRAFGQEELSALLSHAGEHQRQVNLDRKRVESLPRGRPRAELWTSIGRTLRAHLDDAEKARNAFEQALREDPEYLPAIRALKGLATAERDLDRLADLYLREAEVPDAPRAHAIFDAATILARTPEGQRRALPLLKEAFADVPLHFGVVALLEWLCRAARDLRGLLQLHRRQLELTEDPIRRGGLLIRVARLHDELGDTDDAIDAYREAADLDAPESPEALTRLASLLASTGRDEERIAILERLAAASADPEVATSWLERLADAHLIRGDVRPAVATYRRVLGLASGQHPALASAERALERSGLFEELEQFLIAQSATLDGTARADMLIRIAHVQSEGHGNHALACATLRSALELDPNHPIARKTLRALLVQSEQWGELRALIQAEEVSAEDEFRTSPSGEKDKNAVIVEMLRRATWAEASEDENGAKEAYQAAINLGLSAARLALARTGGRHTSLPPKAEGMWTHLEGRQSSDDEVAERSLAWLIERTIDAKLRSFLLAQRAARLDRIGRRSEALNLRREALEGRSRDPMLLTAVEIALEAEGDLPGLIELYRQRLDDPNLDDQVAASVHLRLGQLFEAQGHHREAADAFDRALELDADATLTGRIALVRLHRILGDETRYQVAVLALSQALPAGPLRATTLRRLATHFEESGDLEAAVVNYEDVLLAHPTDAHSLAALERILPALGEEERMIDPLMRALNAERDPRRRAVLGAHLAVRLILRGRLTPARDAIRRVLERDPRQLEALMLSAEVHEHQGDLDAAYGALRALLDLELDAEVRVEAVRRAVHLAVDLGREGEAETLSRRLGATATLPALDAYIEVHARLGGWSKVAQGLRERFERTTDAEQRRMLILHLARVQEQYLEDPKAALATLCETHGFTSPETIEEVLRLGERTSRWDLAAEALENALALGQLEPDFELAVRRRLAALLEGPLGRPDQAIAHYERVVELDPTTGVRQRLAELADNPHVAIEHLRALLESKPDDADHYRQLRLRFLDSGREDGAFCAEAVLVGLGVANEEEEYFYRRRRARLARELPHDPLPMGELVALVGDNPLIAVLEALAPALEQVFPVDLASYGIDDPVLSSNRCADAVRSVSTIFGQRVHIIETAGRLAPATEPALRIRGESRPAVLLPRNLTDLVRREQLFLAGVLVGRIALQGVLFDSARIAPTTRKEIAYLLDAARVTFLGAPPQHEGAVYDDLRARLRSASLDTDALRTALSALPKELDLDAISRDIDVAAARCGIVTAVDPAIAVRGLSDHAPLFTRGPLDAVHALPFAVSEPFLALRRKLGVFR